MHMSGKYNNLSVKPEHYHSQNRSEMLQYIPESAKIILDVGCGEAGFSKLLKYRNNPEIWGIELNPEAAKNAEKIIDKVITGDILSNIDNLPDTYFDCIIFNDILEHLIDPYTVVNRIKSKLSQDGVVVSSIPNVRYIKVLLKLLLKKQWKYEDYGVLDKTHLRFFSRKDIIQMFEDNGYDILIIEGINPINIWKFLIFNIISLWHLSDARYLQFATIARPKK